MKETHLKCRTLGHRWDEAHIPYTGPSTSRIFRFRVSLRCDRCGMVRHDAINAWGDVASRYYDPPEGYAWTSDEALPTRADFRRLLWAEEFKD